MPRNRLTRDPSGIRCSKPLVPPVKLLLPPTVPNWPFFLFAPLFFFVPIASFLQRNFAPGSPRNDDRQLGQLTTSPVLSLLVRFSLSQSRSLPSSDCLQRKSCPSLMCAVPPSLLFHIFLPPNRQRFRSESRL